MCRLCGLNIANRAHPDHPCYSTEQIADNARSALREEIAHMARLNLQLRVATTRISVDPLDKALIAAIRNDVLARDPRERDFSPTAVWTLRPDLQPYIPTVPHVDSHDCECIECTLDANTMPLWVHDLLDSSA